MTTPRRRQAKAITETVTFLCPHCESVIPAPDGGDYWTTEEIVRGNLPKSCSSCDAPIVVAMPGLVRLQ